MQISINYFLKRSVYKILTFVIPQTLAGLTETDRKSIASAKSICKFAPLVKVKQSREGQVEHVPDSLAGVISELRAETVKIRIRSAVDALSNLAALAQSTSESLQRSGLASFALKWAINAFEYIAYISEVGQSVL